MLDFKLPDVNVFDSLVSLTKKRDVLSDNLQKKKDRILDIQRQINELNAIKADISTALNTDLYDLKDLNRQVLLEQQKREEELKHAADMREMRLLDDEIKLLCEGFGAYDKAHAYQIEDVISTIQAYRAGKRGMLNANDMGMGKTFESAIVLYVLNKLFQEEFGRKPKVLWLTKKSLVVKESTKKELQKWNPDLKILQPLVNGTAQQRDMVVDIALGSDKVDVVIANYEFVRTTNKARKSKWDIVVIDEVHKLKGGANSGGPTAIWEAVRDVCLQSEFVLMLSGTPMVNAPEEMWSYLHIFNPTKFDDVKKFKRDFMDYKSIAGEYKLVVDANKILNNVLKGQMIRRGAAEVGLQIPELTYEVIELERSPEQDKVYKQMQNNFFVWLDEQHDKPLSAMAIIAQLTRLRQINVWPSGIHFKETKATPDGTLYEVDNVLDIRESSKIDETMDIIDNVQDQVIVFSTFNEPLFEVQRRCKEKGISCEVIAGGVKHTIDVEAEFQQGRITVLCLNSSMGEGLNLQKNPEFWPGGSSYGVFLDLWWSPARNEQCVARIHRQGSNIPVFIYELQNVPSVDQFIKAKNEEKTEQFSSIMESSVIRPASEWKLLFGGV